MPAIRLRLFLPLLLLLTGVLGFWVLYKTRPRPPAPPVEEKVWEVAVMAVEPATLHPAVPLYGRAESYRRPVLRAAVAADVKKVEVREGERVEKGQVLVELDDREIRFDLAAREADLEEIEAQIQSELHRYQSDQAALRHEEQLLALLKEAEARARTLLRQKLGSQAALDEARQAVVRQTLSLESRRLAVVDHGARLKRLEAMRQRAQALVERARLDLERTSVRAPFDGRIIEVDVAPGDRVERGGALLHLYEKGRLQVRALIPARYLPVVREALGSRPLAARAQVDGRPVELSLRRLAGEVREDQGSVEGLFDVVEGELRPGRFLDGWMFLPPVPDAVPLPAEAIYGQDLIYLERGGRMKALRVERLGLWLAPSGERRLLVRSPALKRGERVVLTHLPNAIDGLKVRVAP